TGVSHLLGKAVLAEVRAGVRCWTWGLAAASTPSSPPRRRRTSKDAGFHNEVVARRTLHKDGWQVDYLTFRMTQLALAP
ncbi:MAG: hypothetical protein WKF51_08805, partial [Geodermatophilaceae bacterium]